MKFPSLPVGCTDRQDQHMVPSEERNTTFASTEVLLPRGFAKATAITAGTCHVSTEAGQAS